MKREELNKELRRQAIKQLEESTKLFKRAFDLQEAGNPEELEEALDVARKKRFHSAFLMRQANRLENAKN